MALAFNIIPTFLFACCCFVYGNCISNLTSKRGLAYLGDKHESDNQLLLSENSTISWYYTWSTYPSEQVGDSVPFVPLIHGLDDASDSDLVSRLNGLPSSSTHLLTFNEPDGETDSGGSSISAEDAAKSYMSYIAPLRNKTSSRSRTWKISYPVVTGSDRGLKWLRSFNKTCFELDDNGCPMDFVALHWYGDYDGLKSWLETLGKFYNGTTGIRYWITEMALPQQDEDATISMLNQTLPYLDNLDYVQAYAWFGAFRSDEANEWTGDSVSIFKGNGDLTELGALYLGGQQRGFEAGMSGSHSLSPNRLLLVMFSLAVLML